MATLTVYSCRPAASVASTRRSRMSRVSLSLSLTWVAAAISASASASLAAGVPTCAPTDPIMASDVPASPDRATQELRAFWEKLLATHKSLKHQCFLKLSLLESHGK